MYSDYGTFGFVLGVHAIVRWLVIALGLTAAARAWIARLRPRPWTRADTAIGRLFAVSLDVQALVGLALYGVFSPVVAAGLSNLSVTSGSRVYRFWLLEHPVAMVVALALAHAGLWKARRADGPAAQRHAALYFTMAVVIVLAAIPWPFFTFGRALWPLR